MTSLVLVAAVLAIALLTAGAAALRTVSRIWLRHWVDRGLAGATLASLYLDRPQRLMITAGSGVASAAFVVGWAAAGVRASGESASGPALGTAVVAVVVVLFVVAVAQPAARAAALRWPTRFVPALVPVIRAADIVVAPARMVGHLSAARARRAVARERARQPVAESRTELEDLLREGEREGVSEQDEMAIISGVVQFAEKQARDVMTPRAQLFALDAALSPREIAAAVAQSGYSRVPLYRGSVDHVVGIVHAFDVLKTAGESMPPVLPVYNAPADVPCNELLFAMLRARRHLAIVRDADRTIGMLTLEDLIEQLVGEINDEHDEPRTAAS